MSQYAYGKSLLPSTVGFDRLLSTLNEVDEIFNTKKPSTYPPYNIVKFDDDNYQIQIAVAGFSKDDIDIETKNHQLMVNGSIRLEETNAEYLYHGLASRDFSHSFKLSDTVFVKSADIVNGVLKINLENILPEEKKPRKIPIGEHPPLLTNEKK
jgi:molecular chaperone IbpA